tara:strand:+ start:414 stop:821 length:408 start_codon:yes stop_codon:yes gene_type:complete
MNTFNANKYQRNQILLSNPGQVLLALYDGAIRFARWSRVHIENGDHQAKGENISKTMDVLAELSATLNHEAAPELGEQLDMIYNYLLGRLWEASRDMSVEPIDEVILHLEKLRQTWGEAVRANAAASKVAVAGGK